jgi:hypothetical protein
MKEHVQLCNAAILGEGRGFGMRFQLALLLARHSPLVVAQLDCWSCLGVVMFLSRGGLNSLQEFRIFGVS